MNTALFIAKKIIFSKNDKATVSSPIIKIAVVAVAIGIIMMLVAIATGIGLQEKIREKISSFNGHIIISHFDDNQSQVTVEPISTVQPFYPKFKSVSSVKHIQGVATKAGIIRTEKSFEGIIFKGVGKDFMWQNLQEYLTKGRLPNLKSNLNNEVIISEFLANRLMLKVGDNFNTFFMKDQANELPNLRVFKIVGIYNSGFPEFDATYLIGDIRHIQKINHWKPDQVGAFEVFVDDFNQIKSVGTQVYKEIGATLNATTIVDKYVSIFDWLQLFDYNTIVIIIVMIIIATINMSVVLLVLILERTQTIGILKAIGADNWTIQKIFLYNATYIILKGLFWGNFLGLSLLYIQKYFGVISLNPENYYVNTAPISFNYFYFIAVNALTILICFVILIIPTTIIGRISPIKAIKFD